MSKTCVIIPAYNEEKNIGAVLDKCRKYVDRVIVVDDGSTDNTYREVLKYGIEPIRFEENRGKGAAIKRGIAEALQSNFDIVVTLDADGEHDPKQIPKLLQELHEGSDLVIGSRLMRERRMRSFARYLLNIFTNFWIKTALDIDLKDTQCGFRAVKLNSLKEMDLRSEGFEIEMEMLLQAGGLGMKIKEVPVSIPKHSRSRLKLKDMVKMDIFFDKWTLRYITSKDCKLQIHKKLFLGIFLILGLLLFYPMLLLLTVKENLG